MPAYEIIGYREKQVSFRNLNRYRKSPTSKSLNTQVGDFLCQEGESHPDRPAKQVSIHGQTAKRIVSACFTVYFFNLTCRRDDASPSA